MPTSTDAIERLVSIERRSIDPDWMVSCFEWCPLATVLVNREGTVYLVNSAAEKMFGRKRADLIGQSVNVLLPEGRRTRHVKHLDTYANEPFLRTMGKGLDLRAIRRTEAGEEIEIGVAINLVPIYGRHGLMTAAYITEH